MFGHFKRKQSCLKIIDLWVRCKRIKLRRYREKSSSERSLTRFDWLSNNTDKYIIYRINFSGGNIIFCRLQSRIVCEFSSDSHYRAIYFHFPSPIGNWHFWNTFFPLGIKQERGYFCPRCLPVHLYLAPSSWNTTIAGTHSNLFITIILASNFVVLEVYSPFGRFSNVNFYYFDRSSLCILL